MAVSVNPDQPDPGSQTASEVIAAAQSVGQELAVINVKRDEDFETAFKQVTDRRAAGILVMADPYLNNRREKIVAFAAQHGVPAIYEWREAAVAGGLMSYGSAINDAFRQLGLYTGQVLNGTKPSELPVMQAVKVELVLNQDGQNARHNISTFAVSAR